MLEDLFDLRAVQGFVLEQRFCDCFKCVAISNKGVLGELIGVVDQPAHFLVDLFGRRFAVIARTGNVASEEDVIFVFAVFDHSHFFAHAKTRCQNERLSDLVHEQKIGRFLDFVRNDKRSVP